jgi:uncharacterized protein (DUF1778 family)
MAGKVRIRCDVLSKVLRELDKDDVLREIYSGKVSESLTVVAEDGDLLIEDGGCIDLSQEEKGRFMDSLGGLVRIKVRTADIPKVASDRIRIRCDILLRIVSDLGGSAELKAMFGGNVLESLYAVADGSDLKIESDEALNLSEDQTSVFLNILNEVIEDNTST